jgi:oligoribonuclease
MKEERRQTKMFWLDMEMTGLDDKTCKIPEVAVVVTDLDLKPSGGDSAVVAQPPEALASMDEWCTKTHRESGLTAEVATGTPIGEVEKRMIEIAKSHFGKERVVLCGNSIFQDRKFIDRYMPAFAKLLHYRLIDISSFKEIFRNKYGIEFEKKDTHRARVDIFESIAELNHYLSYVKL